jgi:tetratricopeptide (TPR) repeat protein
MLRKVIRRPPAGVWRMIGALVSLIVPLLSGCGRAPAPGQAAPPAARQPAALIADADARLAAEDWAGAARAYEEALASDPESVHARYRLGVAYSALGRAEEAAQAFLWVAAHAGPGHEEARLAAQWLRDSGRMGPAQCRWPSRTAEI